MTNKPDLSKLAVERPAGLRSVRPPQRFLVHLSITVAVIGLGAIAWKWLESAPLLVETAVVTAFYPSQAITLFNATGHVVAQRKASLASKATGRLEWLGVLEGSTVRAGEVIARLESRDAQAIRDQSAASVLVAQANLDQAKADLSEAELGFKRSAELHYQNFLSASAHDIASARLAKVRAAVAGCEAAVSVARANLRVSEIGLDQTLIRAPFDGVVIARNANVGDTITPFSQAVDTKGAVVSIVDMTSLEVEVDVSESSLSGVRMGQAIEVQLDAIPGQRFKGRVNRIVPTMDRAKASILVKIRLLSMDSRILPDMTAKAAFLEREIAEGETKPVFAVPANALIDVGGVKNVYLVREGAARLQSVTLGAKIGDQFEVRGLEPGTRVVIRPPQGLSDGRSVRKVEQ